MKIRKSAVAVSARLSLSDDSHTMNKIDMHKVQTAKAALLFLLLWWCHGVQQASSVSCE